jgi:hypothetical protein
MGTFADREPIQRTAQFQDLFSFQVRIVSDVETVKMHMIECGVFFKLRIAQELSCIGLPELIAAS